MPPDDSIEWRAAVVRAMEPARRAQVGWAERPLTARLAPLRKLRGLLADHALELAQASASARARPVQESLTAEVLPLVDACRFLEREAGRILAPRRLGSRGRPLWLAGVRSEVRREPLGVVLVIGPGNYPLLLPGVQLIQALVAGNAVVLKPGLGGRGAAMALRELTLRAGIDPDLVVLLPESAQAARAAIEAGPDKVIFTGSARVGEAVLAQLAPVLIPAAMELSGCDAALIRADADLDAAADALVFSLRLNAGATCLAPRRVFVAESLAAALEKRLASLLQQDHSHTAAHAQGRRAMERMASLAADALAKGARLVVGNVDADGALRRPLVLADVPAQASLLREDVFAPVLALIAVRDDEEALQRVADCPYALTASIFSRDERAAWSLAGRIQAGVVTINDLILPTADPRLPFGGRKRSGFGVTRGAEGLLELTAPKVVTISRRRLRPAVDAPATDATPAITAYLQLAHGRSLSTRARACAALLRSIFGKDKSTGKELDE